ncbi:MAG: acyl-phosphate glycerol 3-phosphate acyltransferase [Candidatus Omnitrophica bacterium CG1_02_49_10]|nr:MAG: acyl-phosphate glycerol 3-phosphate acyltransferase [Candidatus Omnitrophica bacterium CG1_02_49_10]
MILLSVVMAYLLGSLPTGFILVKLIKGEDIRSAGSGNIGATNVVRVLGKGYGAIVLAIDILKGYIALAALAALFYNAGFIALDRSVYFVLMGVAAILGHTFTVFLNFKGGKGVATTAGALLAMAPGAIVIGLIVWLITFRISRYVSLSSIAAAVAVPLSMLLLKVPLAYVIFAFHIGGFIIYKHKQNITRLLKREEHRFGKKGRRVDKSF